MSTQDGEVSTAVSTRPLPPTALVRGSRALRSAIDQLSGPRAGVQPIVAGTISRVLVLWGAARALNIALLWAYYELSVAGKWGFGPDQLPATTFLRFLSDWDGARYGRISQIGYPETLPIDSFGIVQPNDWAFLPVYPALERGLSEITGMPWQLAGVIISVLASAGATLMLFLLLRRLTTPDAAWWGVVLFSVGPLSFIFVLAYAESLFLLLLFASLLLAVDRRYLWIAPLGAIAAFTRPGVLALALALGILFVVRWIRRADDAFTLREQVGLVVSGLVTAVAGLTWPVIAEHVTGVTDAYLRTETSWWVPFIGTGGFVPFTQWFRLAGTHLGVVGVIIVLVIVTAFVAWLCSAAVRRMGVVVVAFAASYGAYLFAVFLPQQSLFRLVLPLAPLLADERLSSSPRRRQWSLWVAIGLQVVAILLLWTIGWP
ncbi:hypothetical protein [Microbacterium sp. P01]|uniref:hypothetical protein n=1 Tax=unclassified Microbacterium TaxID=2609290 RepID=UPI00366FD4EB